MAVFEVLSEMIGPEEFLALVTFAELVYVDDMAPAGCPVRRGVVGKVLATVSADVSRGRTRRGWRLGVGRVVCRGGNSCRRMECSIDVSL